MALPTRGQHDWDDDLNNYIAGLDSRLQSAEANATSAQSNANDARNMAQGVSSNTDSQTAYNIQNGPQTQATLAAAFVPLGTPTKHAPGFGLYFPEAEGAVGDGTTADTAAIQAAINAAAAAGGGVVRFRPVTYATGPLTLKSKVSIDGPYATLKKVSGSIGVSLLTATGTLGTSTAITADVAKAANTLTVTSATGFAVGDYVLLRDATYAYSTFGRNQEIARIAGISGTTITLAEYALGKYAAASSAEMVKLTPVAGVSVRGVTLTLPAGQVGGGVMTVLSTDITVRDCTISGFSDNPGITFTQSSKCRGIGNRLYDGVNVSSSGQGYGLQLADSSHHCLFANNVVDNVRENMFTNNVRVSAFVNNVVSGVWGTGFNTHGSGCKNITVTGNAISGSLGYGIAVGHGSDNVGDENVVIANNVISSCAGAGIITNSGSTATANRSKGVVINANVVRDVGLTASGNAAIWTLNSDHAIITNNTIDCAGVTNTVHGIVCNKTEYGATVANNTIRNILGRGIRITNVTTEPVLVQGNRMYGVASFQLMVDPSSTAPVPAVFIDNYGMTNSVSLLGTEVLIGNRLGGVWNAPTVTGSRGGNAALASLLTALANGGRIKDSTTA